MPGSLVDVWIDGANYLVLADVEIDIEPKEEIEDIEHSGGTMPKVMKKAAPAADIPLIVTKEERATLKEINGVKGKSMGFEEQDGTVNNCTGYIKLGNYNTGNSTIMVSMVPQEKTGWDIV